MSADNLDMNLNDADTLRQLLTEENDAIISYRERANTVKDPKVKAVLLNIANEEVSHTGELQQLLSQVDNTNDKLVAEGEEEVKDMDEEQIEKAYQDFVKADQPNKTSIEDKLDVLLAQNQQIKVDTERTADAVAEETAGDEAENEVMGEDFADGNDLDGLDGEGEDLNLSDDIPGETEEETAGGESEVPGEESESEGDITEAEGEAEDTSDIEEVSGEEPTAEDESDVVEGEEESDVIEDESPAEEQSDVVEEESDVIEDESEAEPTEDTEDTDQKKKDFEKALRTIEQLRKENIVLKAKLKRQTISKSNEVEKPVFKQIKPLDRNLLKLERRNTRPALSVMYGGPAIRPGMPTENLVKTANDEKLVVGIGKNYKEAMAEEWNNLFNQFSDF